MGAPEPHTPPPEPSPALSSSSFNSFHSAVSHQSRSSLRPSLRPSRDLSRDSSRASSPCSSRSSRSVPSPRQSDAVTHSTVPPVPSKHSHRSRWFFHKDKTPQPSTPPRLPKRARTKDRPRMRPDESRYHRNVSDRSSLASEERRVQPPSSRLQSPTSNTLRSAPHTSAPHSTSAPNPPLSHHPSPYLQSNAREPSEEDDWGIDELVDDDAQPVPVPHNVMSRTSAVAVPATPPLSHRDTITLRAFDDALEQTTESAAPVRNVIGVFDPAAETDEWGDDFDLEQSTLPAAAQHHVPGKHSFPQWLVQTSSPPNVHALTSATPLPPLLDGDHPLRIRLVPATAFATPKLTHASLLMFPGAGYQAAPAHPSCAQVKQLFANESANIRVHLDALVRDSGGTIALEHRTRATYLLARDHDIAALAPHNMDLVSEILRWKLECARLQNDRAQSACLLLALSNIHKHRSNFRDAIALVHEALHILSDSLFTNFALALAIELEYENCLLHQTVGAMAEAGRAVKHAVTHAVELSSRQERQNDLNAPQQRGLWWQLRCKFVQAELAYDLQDHDLAVRLYCEYINEGISRMIGITSPPRSPSIGTPFMRFCIFSPPLLVVAMWTTVLSLGEMRAFPAAADMVSLTSLIATAFGYADAVKAASIVRARIKDMGTELREQYDMITRNISQGGEIETDNMSVTRANQIAASSFDYNLGDFGDFGDEDVEDWDAQLEKELNITIQRCNDDNPNGDGAFVSGHAPSPLTRGASATPLPGPFSEENGTFQGAGGIGAIAGSLGPPQPDISRWATGPQHGNLVEAELRNYLGRVAGAASALSAPQMYPKPTQPFNWQLMGPREHENFLRQFVRSKDPILAKRKEHRLPVTPQWHPSAVCKLNFNIEPIEDIEAFNSGIQFLSPAWGLRLLEAVWKVVRSHVPLRIKQSRARRLILNSFSRVSAAARKSPPHDEADRLGRLKMLGALLDAMRLAREVVTESGNEAVWFSRAVLFLGSVAATVTPAAKAAVELFQAESRAHCGLHAVVSAAMLQKCGEVGRQQETDSDLLDERSGGLKLLQRQSTNPIPASLRQTVVDVMHGLYWRTKAGFDESSNASSLEKLLHADVASSLFLTGCGISPVDGSSIDLTNEMSILHLPKNRKTGQSGALVDETRRVSSSELISELRSLWSSLPSTSGLVRAKVSFALAHQSKLYERDSAFAERFLFDGLMSIHEFPYSKELPNSFFCSLLRVSPVSIVSSPLAGALLQEYGMLTLCHSKHRYGIAALEAAVEAQRVRNMDKQVYRSSVLKVVDAALNKSDWRRALMLLFNLRYMVHPKNGFRNDFLHLCVQLHSICMDIGCFQASIVPLRAFSALIYEERLRVLLQRYRRRLAKKSRNKFRRYMPGNAFPKLLPGAAGFPNRKNALASFFETPISTTLDNTIRQSAFKEPHNRHYSTIAVPNQAQERKGSSLMKLLALLLPLHVLVSKKTPRSDGSQSHNQRKRASEPIMRENSKLPKTGSALSFGNETQHTTSTQIPDRSEHEEEQRELLRIEAEQEAAADSDRFRVEFLRARTEHTRANYSASESRCRGLLELSLPHTSRFMVLELMARIRLKRREITRCLEILDEMERTFHQAAKARGIEDIGRLRNFGDAQRMSIFRMHDSDRDSGAEVESERQSMQVIVLRLRALTHGGRLSEALDLADKAIEGCDEHSFWDLGRLHYLRGKVLYEMSCPSTSPYEWKDDAMSVPNESASFNAKLVEHTMTAFEAGSKYYEAAGNEIGSAKSDLLWARTCIDFVFRRVVLSTEAGGGMNLGRACKLLDKEINFADVLDIIHNVITTATTANVPLLLVNAMAALAEIKYIQGQPSSSWSGWVSEAWKLFSRLFTDGEDFTVVLSSIAPVSTLMRLRNLCGRLVRLVMCDSRVINFSEMNTHLRLFEAYVTLHLSIDKKLNLAYDSQKDALFDIDETEGERKSSVPESEDSLQQKNPRTSTDSSRQRQDQNASSERNTVKNGKQNVSPISDIKSDCYSELSSESTASRRPASAFLHMISNEGVALGRQGLSLFINRPRQQVISAVKGTGAVLIPTNFFSTSKTGPEYKPHALGTDVEMIFPFKPDLGLGAMHILNEDADVEDEVRSIGNFTLSQSNTRTTASKNRLIESLNSDSTSGMKQTNSSKTSEKATMSSSKSSGARSNENRGTISDATESDAIEEKNKRDSASADSQKETQDSIPREEETKERKEFPRIPRNDLAVLVKTIREELDGDVGETDGSSPIFGVTLSEKVWAHLHRIKTETKRYEHGEITIEQLQSRNSDALLGWVHCNPLSRKEWTVPESIGRRLVYILYAHGVLGYYAVDDGGSVQRIAFGGKQRSSDDALSGKFPGSNPNGKVDTCLRSPLDGELRYLYDLVKGFKRDGLWHKDRDSEIIQGLGNNVLGAPREFLSSSSMLQRSRSRPIVLVADLPLQILPWELFFDHVVIRSHCLLDVIRGLQEEEPIVTLSHYYGNEERAITAARKLVRFISFGSSRRDLLDLENTEEARRQQLAFQSLLRLNHMDPRNLVSFLDLGGFLDPTAVDAIARHTGPLSSPLSQSRKGVQLFGLRISAKIGRRNYPHVDFLKVTGLGSATTGDLKEAAMVLLTNAKDILSSKKDLGAFIPVFMFSYADLVNSSDSVFGLRVMVPYCILMFTPAVHMKVLARHLEDDELNAELARASNRIHNVVAPDVMASARALIEYVSRFSREKRIPIVVFLGQALVDVFPRKRLRADEDGEPAKPAERIAQLTGVARVDNYHT
ncbi:unnamed protein product [Agarophyton chilense]